MKVTALEAMQAVGNVAERFICRDDDRGVTPGATFANTFRNDLKAGGPSGFNIG